MKDNEFSKTAKLVIIFCIIIFTLALAYREYQVRGGSYGWLGTDDYIYKDNNSRR